MVFALKHRNPRRLFPLPDLRMASIACPNCRNPAAVVLGSAWTVVSVRGWVVSKTLKWESRCVRASGGVQGSVFLEACRAHRSLLALDVLFLMLSMEVLKAASSRAPTSGRLVSTSRVSSMIFLMQSMCSSSWAGFWAGVYIVFNRASMLRTLVGRLTLGLARVV